MKERFWWKDTVAAGFMMVLVLAAVPFLDMSSDHVMSPEPADRQAGMYAFDFASYDGSKKADTEHVYYSDQFFDNVSSEYDHQLAQASLALALTGFEYSYAENFLAAIGYGGIENYRYDQKTDEDKAGLVFAHKNVGDQPVIAVCVRGGNYGDEWGSNGRLAGDGTATGYHYGFHAAAEDALQQLADYAAAQNLQLYGSKIWLTGYSRGAAVANVLGEKLQEYEVISSTDLYCYTFAAPSVVSAEYLEQTGTGGSNVSGIEDGAVSDRGIYNIVNPLDIVTRLPMDASGKSETKSGRTVTYGWDYVKYGATLELPVKREDDLQVVELLENSLAFATRNDQKYVEKYQDDVVIPLLKENMGSSASKTRRDNIISALIDALPGVTAFIVRELNDLDFKAQLYIGNMISGAEEQRLLQEHWPETYWSLMQNVSEI